MTSATSKHSHHDVVVSQWWWSIPVPLSLQSSFFYCVPLPYSLSLSLLFSFPQFSFWIRPICKMFLIVHTFFQHDFDLGKERSRRLIITMSLKSILHISRYLSCNVTLYIYLNPDPHVSVAGESVM